MTETEQPQPKEVHVQQVSTACKVCGGPIIYERDLCAMFWLLCCCGCWSFLCMPKRHAECAACGAKQGYSIRNTHSC